MAPKKAAIGIDIGTAYCRVGVWKDGKAQVIEKIPSCVAFGDNLTVPLYGEEAHDQAHSNPCDTVLHVMRLVGRRMAEHAVKEDKKLWSFKVVAPNLDDNDEPAVAVQLDGVAKKFSAVHISSMLLKKLKETAERHLGEEDVKDAVISVPSSFNDSQRRAIIDAAKEAGLNVMRILNETSAVAIDYGFLKKESIESLEERRKRMSLDLNIEYQHVNKKRRTGEQVINKEYEENILVFDLGGGTMSAAVMHIKEDKYGRKIRVKSVAGDTHLGGKDLDDCIMRLCIDKFTDKHNVVPDIFINFEREQDAAGNAAKSMSRLRTECERAKISLSSGVQAVETIEVESFYNGRNLAYTLPFDKFEEISSDLLKKCGRAIRQCLLDARLDQFAVDKVILVGGSSRLPGIQKLMKSLFSEKIELVGQGTVPEDAVVCGAAIHAALLSGKATYKKAIKYALSDVAAFDIAIATSSGMKTLIKRNATLPTQADYFLTTSSARQKTVEVRVYERAQVCSDMYSNFLGLFTIGNIPPAPEGWPKITATFKFDRDGVLDGSALDTLDPDSRSLAFHDYAPNPSHDPYAFTPGYDGYKCSVTVRKGRFIDGDIEATADRAAVTEEGTSNEAIHG